MRKLPVILFLITLFVNGCRKDPKPNSGPQPQNNYSGEVKVNITNVADSLIVQIVKDTVYTALTPKYINAAGDTFSITKLRYYISNVKLKMADGSYFYEPESYHLIDAADSINTCHFTIKNVPAQSYTQMEFIIGVDSARNVSGAQTGDLDPLKDMFWSWGQGYIFFKFEGYTSSVPNSGFHNLQWHIGGFVNPLNFIRSAVVPISPLTLNVETNKTSNLFMKTNIQEAFRNSNILSFSYLTSITSDQAAKQICSNYTDMFTIVAVK